MTTQNLYSEEHSEEIQDLIDKTPSWPIRWGMTAILFLLMLIIVGSYYVRYPEIIQARIVLTTQHPPISIFARTSGKIALKVLDNQVVNSGVELALIDNAADEYDITRLKKIIRDYHAQLRYNSNFLLKIIVNPYLQLGDMQTVYAQLLTDLTKYQLTEQIVLHEKRINAVSNRISQYQKLNDLLRSQLETQKSEFEIVQKRMAMSELLFKDHTIAENDYNQAKISFLHDKRALEASQNEFLTNEMAVSQLKSQIIELNAAGVDEKSQQRNAVISDFRRLESQLSLWQQQYIISSPIAGKVSIAKFLSDQQFVSTGAEIATVVPNTKGIYGQVSMPVAGSGKVLVGQQVRIKLDNYPYAEYGMLMGRIKSISSIPRDGIYTIQVELINGLITSYRKQLAYRPQIGGSAEIVTKDLSVLQRLFFKFRQLINKTN